MDRNLVRTDDQRKTLVVCSKIVVCAVYETSCDARPGVTSLIKALERLGPYLRFLALFWSLSTVNSALNLVEFGSSAASEA